MPNIHKFKHSSLIYDHFVKNKKKKTKILKENIFVFVEYYTFILLGPKDNIIDIHRVLTITILYNLHAV